MAVSEGLPVLGICRGAQVMNVAFGGTLYQNIPTQLSDTYVNHRISAGNKDVYKIGIVEGSLLHGIMGPSEDVNSSHHHSVRKVVPGFVI